MAFWARPWTWLRAHASRWQARQPRTDATKWLVLVEEGSLWLGQKQLIVVKHDNDHEFALSVGWYTCLINHLSDLKTDQPFMRSDQPAASTSRGAAICRSLGRFEAARRGGCPQVISITTTTSWCFCTHVVNGFPIILGHNTLYYQPSTVIKPVCNHQWRWWQESYYRNNYDNHIGC